MLPAGAAFLGNGSTLACGESCPSAAMQGWASGLPWPLRESGPAGVSALGIDSAVAGRAVSVVTPRAPAQTTPKHHQANHEPEPRHALSSQPQDHASTTPSPDTHAPSYPGSPR